MKFFPGLLVIYGIVAYIAIPQVERMKIRGHPDLVAGEHLTKTNSGIPGDPLNIALVGNEADLVEALQAAGWNPATALGLSSSLRIAVDTVFDRPDPGAPVSNLYLYGRKEDLAFEKPVGNSPRERHHVRFWKAPETKGERPLWMGSATHDTGVELSHTTGQVTHRIAPQVDDERDFLIAELQSAQQVLDIDWVDGYQKVTQGRNGGGDPWQTDGRLPIITLASSAP
ncbi:MAG: LssY C-terminal domain-containing protein [Luteolibacter sp.]